MNAAAVEPPRTIRSQIHHLVTRGHEGCGGSPALTYRGESWTYDQLADSVRAVATGLAHYGLVRSDRVSVFLEKRFEAVAAIFGTSAVRGVFVPVNPLLKPAQVAFIVNDSESRVLITSLDRYRQIIDLLGDCESLEVVVIVGIEADQMISFRDQATPQKYSLVSWLDLIESTTSADDSGTESDVAAIFYTSGSTGTPKGVVLSHRNIVAGARSVSSYLRNTSDDVILALLPISFDAGFSQMTTAFEVGAHLILINYLTARDAVRACETYQVTGITAVPPLWMQLVEPTWPVETANRIRYFANTGGRMPRTTLNVLRETFPHAKPYLMYGLTEAFRSTYLDPEEVDRRPDSIGKAIPNAEVLVLRPDGTECASGEEGELVHRGPLVALGYWNDPARTAERFRPWPPAHRGTATTEVAVWSGDTVVRDDDGFLFFVGRTDEMIKTSGYRISPTEIEEVVYATGMVRDAVALGVPDEKLGHRIVLLVSGTTQNNIDTDALQVRLRRDLPLYMRPAQIVTMTSLPRSPNGKFDRVLLRNTLSEAQA